VGCNFNPLLVQAARAAAVAVHQGHPVEQAVVELAY